MTIREICKRKNIPVVGKLTRKFVSYEDGVGLRRKWTYYVDEVGNEFTLTRHTDGCKIWWEFTHNTPDGGVEGWDFENV